VKIENEGLHATNTIGGQLDQSPDSNYDGSTHQALSHTRYLSQPAFVLCNSGIV
jgi:hypothetical protein